VILVLHQLLVMSIQLTQPVLLHNPALGALISRAKFNFYHGTVATRLNTDVDVLRYSSHATGEEYHYYVTELNESFYIDETHGETNTGVARTIYFTFEPDSGIHDVSNTFGEQTITIWEFA